MRHERTHLRRTAERGYTLTEVMVAITLSVFLLLGLFSILQQTRKTNTATTGLSQLQDDERVAMTIITDTIQAAGYVPEANGSGQSLFVTDSGGGFATAGQVISATAHTSNSISTGDRLTMRYVLGTNDTTLLCDGEQYTGAGDKLYKEIFQVDINSAGTYQLMCVPSNGAAAVPIVNNVVSLNFQFGVNSTSAGTLTKSNTKGPNTEASNATGYGCPADSWVVTASMSTSDWTNVCSVKVDMVFINPLYQPAGQAQPTPGQKQYVTFERVIGLLSKTGVNVSTVTGGPSSSGGSTP